MMMKQQSLFVIKYKNYFTASLAGGLIHGKPPIKVRPFLAFTTWAKPFARYLRSLGKKASERQRRLDAEVAQFKSRFEQFFERHIGPFFT